MVATLLAAVLVVFASVVIGRTAMLALGWTRPEWMAGAVGFALLVIVAPFAVRLPGRGVTAAILIALAAIACTVVTRRAVPQRSHSAPREGAAAAQHLVPLVVVPLVLAIACVPFLVNGHMGVLGEGIYTNDQAAQLYWADWLATGFGPQPSAVSFGYPVGPQALAAAVSEGTGTDLLDAFNGLLIAIPALTALTALSVLAQLPPLRRGVAGVLVGMPYLGASFLAQSGFKETSMAMFVVALAVTLHLATRRDGEDLEPPPARSVVGVIAILAAASVFTFSIPGGVWFGVAVPVWLILVWGFGRSDVSLADLRAQAAEHRSLLIGGAVALVALAAVALGPASGFIDKIGSVQESSGRLSSPVFPGEAFGIWFEGDFRVVRGEASYALLASGFGGLCVLAGAAVAAIRREWALVSVLGAAAFVYALSRPFAEIHVEAKALAVMAPIAMLVALRWLLATTGGGLASRARLAVGAAFCALALFGSFLALRDAPVGFDDRGREDLRELAEQVDGGSVAFLGVDRFAGYWLRGTLAESPGGYVPRDVPARDEKTWQQGLAMDFDTLSPSRLDDFDYAITTSAEFASTPPPNFSEVATAGDYVLWERSGPTPQNRVLEGEGGNPGERYDCADQESKSDATVLTTPVTAEQEDWGQDFPLAAPGSASTQVELPAGEWGVSLQYHSQVPLTVRADGEVMAELPASLEGFYLVGAGRGAFWPAGEVEGGGPVEVSVEAGEPSSLQDLVGAERKVWLGTLAFSARESPQERALGASCGRYVDHYSKPATK